MIIREVKLIDRVWIDEMYGKHFSNNEYPDFFDGSFLCPFIIADDKSQDILLAGGIKILAEVAIVTDKDKPVRRRMDALLQALGSSITIAKDMGHRQIYVFVNNDDQYVKHLQKYNFKLIDAKLLVLNLGD